MLVLVGGEKGGTGKTTIAVNLAAMAALAGKSVMLADTDKQRSAGLWAGTRTQEGVTPTVPCVMLDGTVGYTLTSLDEKYDVVIIDAGGRDSVELRQAMAVANHHIIPVRPSQFDTWTIDSMANLRREIERRAGYVCPATIVLNAVSANPASRELEETRGLLAEWQADFGTAQACLVDRISYRRAAREGKSVCELQGDMHDKKAVLELNRLYSEIFNEQFHQLKAAA